MPVDRALDGIARHDELAGALRCRSSRAGELAQHHRPLKPVSRRLARVNDTRELRTLPLRLVAQLDLAAASGIAECAGALWVLADDELVLARFDRSGRRTGQITLLPGSLPEEERARKAHKADFEALVSLPDGSLLALGSGSTPARRRAAWVQVAGPNPVSRTIDLTPLYVRLERELPELNIEGGVVLGDVLYLCSRGNGARGDNALVCLDWAACARALASANGLPAEALREISAVTLGELAGQPLSLTDLAVGADLLLFTAAAEASPNTYDDGACSGSALGVLSTRGEVRDIAALSPVAKIEGLWATGSAAEFELLLVADPDDRVARAPLMAARYRPELGSYTV